MVMSAKARRERAQVAINTRWGHQEKVEIHRRKLVAAKVEQAIAEAMPALDENDRQQLASLLNGEVS